jgi:hypothetical protein
MRTILVIATSFSASALAAEDQAAKKSEYRRAAGVRRVYFAIYVMDIDEINSEEQNLAVNVCVRLQWKDERLTYEGTEAKTMPLAVTVPGNGSDYKMAMLGSKQRQLDGSKTYKLRLPPNPPVKDFWAITTYDTQTRSQLQTDQQFPTSGSQSKGLKRNADGSIDVHFSPKPPKGWESNWLQTIPGKSWSIALRLYGPLQPWIDQT